jgi:subtilisin family serine protease
VQGQRPEESINYVASQAGCYAWVVEKVEADRDVCLRLLVPNTLPPLDEWTAGRSLPFPADAPTVMAVAAVDVTSPYDLASDSSQGPTFGPGGACTGGKVKPEAAAYANVTTKTFGPGAYPGTGAAASHMAGAAALIWAAHPGYSAGIVQSVLEARAIDMGPAGKDSMYGAGRLYLGEPPVDFDHHIWLPTLARSFPSP